MGRKKRNKRNETNGATISPTSKSLINYLIVSMLSIFAYRTLSGLYSSYASTVAPEKAFYNKSDRHINYMQLLNLFDPSLSPDEILKNKQAIEKILFLMNEVLLTRLHGEKLARILPNTTLSFFDSSNTTTIAELSRSPTGLVLELLPDLTSRLTLQHESVHAVHAINNRRFLENECRLSENFFKIQASWAAPFYPHSIDEMHYYTSLIQEGMDRVRRTMDLFQKETISKEEERTLQHVTGITKKYLPKEFMLVIKDGDFPELSTSENIGKLERGEEVRTNIPINQRGSLLTNSNKGNVILSFFVQSQRRDKSGNMVIRGIFSHDPTTAYLFDTLATNEMVNVRQRQSVVIHLSELEAHLMESNTEETYEEFFPELKRYNDKLDQASCPAPRKKIVSFL